MFFWKRKKKSPPPPAGLRKAAETPQKRSTFRMPVEFDVQYTLEGRPGRRRGRAGDLSAGGLRLSCDEDFVRGSNLTLQFHLPDDFLDEMTVEKEVYEQSPFGLRPETIRTRPPGFVPMTIRAKVLSSFFRPSHRTLAHGLAFVDVDRKTEDEVQRFIHLWQLHYLRKRRGDLN